MGTSYAIKTDIGTRKMQNQDAYGLRIACNGFHEIVFAVVCDGVGGMSCGEVASNTVVHTFLQWFDQKVPELFTQQISLQHIQHAWDCVLQQVNRQIFQYSQRMGNKMGTTVAALLMSNGSYYAVNVGDSRIYQLTQEQIDQISRDHTLVQREVEQGLLTPQQARQDTRRNVLTRCVGGQSTLLPQYAQGRVYPNSGYLLCSDGFYRSYSQGELLRRMAPQQLGTESKADRCLLEMIQQAKDRGESDNITAIYLRTDDALGANEDTVDLSDECLILRRENGYEMRFLLP